MERDLSRYALLSLVVALITLAMKAFASQLTGSVGLLSDALESVANLATAAVAFFSLRFAAQPPDEEHEYGHGKIEYFSGGFEGAVILFASLGIMASAVDRALNPQELTDLNEGLLVSLGAAGLNGATAYVLWRAGKTHRSLTLEGEAHHLATDLWTTVGVLVALVGVMATGWLWLDPLVACLVGLNVLRTGVLLLRKAAEGLLDASLPADERDRLTAILDGYRQSDGVDFHAVRTRRAGARSFISFHVLVPGQWSVQQGHQLLERIESDIRQAVEGSTIFTHLEPLEDPCSFADQTLDRQVEVAQGQ
ncbi:MAG: cation transporter [Candidatus Eremiobacteraeota bacterium]|nr:cation transporter [Candidatus Eremiobacteraeota bacterium]